MRRVLFYLFYDPEGQVDDYVLYKLRAVRKHVEHIFVVSNSELTAASHARLSEVADTVWVRENVGFDVWGYKTAMEQFGAERLDAYDELILANYTFFGPIFPFSETFERMDANRDIDFWGMTSHKHMDDAGELGDEETGELIPHIQSQWIVVRRSLFTSFEFQAYWSRMPMIESYRDSIRLHETRFTNYFAERGFRYAIAFPADEYPGDHPALDNPALMLDRRCPIIKRRLFFHESGYLDRWAILGADVIDRIAAAGYPTELIWRNVARMAEPRMLYTNMSMLSVLPDEDPDHGSDPPPRIAVLAHLYYVDMLDEFIDPITRIPVPFKLIVTTSTEHDADTIRAGVARFGLSDVEVRVVESNAGRSESAFLITCHDALVGGEYDLVLKAHAKSSPQDGFNRGDLFKRHTMENLLSSPGQVQRILNLFADDPALGIVIPPMVHVGYPTLGHAWFANRDPAEALAEELEITVPFDDSTPLAAYGGWFWARPEALAKLTARAFRFEEFADDPEAYRDGGLSHVLERLYTYAVLSAGYTVRAVANTRWIAIDYAFLEYKMQRVCALLPPYMEEQIDYLLRLRDTERELERTREELVRLQSANARRGAWRHRAHVGSGRSSS